MHFSSARVRSTTNWVHLTGWYGKLRLYRRPCTGSFISLDFRSPRTEIREYPIEVKIGHFSLPATNNASKIPLEDGYIFRLA